MNRLPAVKALCIQCARRAPRKLSNARPMTMPAAALTSAMRAAIHSTCVRGAPSARRTPNSVVRCATLYATRLKMPTSASPSAMAEKTPNRMEKSRWRLYCASRSMASVSVKVPLKAETLFEICWRRDRCNRGADEVKAGERIYLGAAEELYPGPRRSSVRNVNGGAHRLIHAVVARIADDADDLAPGRALCRDHLIAHLSR